MRKFPLFLLLIFLFTASKTFSQYFYYNDRYYDRDLLVELGGSIGGMNCITDIGGSKGKGGFYLTDMNLRNTRMSGGVYVGVLYKQLVAVRLEATWGSVTAYDSILKGASYVGAQGRYNRNLNFRSAINEVSIIGEFYPLGLEELMENPPRLSPYVAAGLGWFSFNPQINIEGRYYYLQPLRTEGQGFPEYRDRYPYKLRQANVPVGVGVKYELTPLINLRAEVMHRFLFTDYLDDVSTTTISSELFDRYLTPMRAAQAKAVYGLNRSGTQAAGATRGGSDKDSYMTFNVKVGFALGRERRR